MIWIAALLMAVVGVLIALVAIVHVRRSRAEARQQQEQLKQRIDTLEHELSAMMDGAFGVASQLQKVESDLKNTVQQQEQLQQRDRGNLPYNDAVRLVSKGADVDELVEQCGLSRSEAELVTMLHKKSAAQAAGETTEPSSATPPTVNTVLQEYATGEKTTVEYEAAAQNQLRPDLTEVSPEQQEPLFSGDFGGDDFQQALERAREFQSPPETAEDTTVHQTDDKKTASESKDPTKQHPNNDV